jgi:uncharacterized metal-binding protein
MSWLSQLTRSFLKTKQAKLPDLPKKKVGIVSCSGEELPEGTVSRLAALKVLEKLRPADTVTICLPLFLAGGEGDRAFAKFYPTIAVDGCELRCAARATEMYSSKPAASVMVRDLVAEKDLAQPEGRRHLNPAGLQAVEATAERMTALVDEILGKHWDRSAGSFVELQVVGSEGPQETGKEATCSCGSDIPVHKVQVNGKEVVLIALPPIFQQLQEAGKQPSEAMSKELLDTVRIYNPIPPGEEEQFRMVLLREYAAFCEKGKAQ